MSSPISPSEPKSFDTHKENVSLQEELITFSSKEDATTAYRNTLHCHQDILNALQDLKTTAQSTKDTRASLLLESYERLSHNLETQAQWSLLSIVGSVIGMAGAGFDNDSTPNRVLQHLGMGVRETGSIMPKSQEPYNKAIEGLQTQLNNFLSETRESLQDIANAKREIDNKLSDILKLKSQMEQESLRSRL